MKLHAPPWSLVLLVTAQTLSAQNDESPLASRLAPTAAHYEQRVEAATDELNQTRARIATERVPLVRATRQLQQEIVALETELTLLRAEAARAENDRLQLAAAADELRRNLAYVRSTAEEQLQAIEAQPLAGEWLVRGAEVSALRARLQEAATDARSVGASFALTLGRIEQLVGGHQAAGSALASGNNVLRAGQFVFLGPETYFRANDETLQGIVRTRAESDYVVVHSLGDWRGAAAAALFRGDLGAFPADAQGGKALRLADARGTWRDHVRKGGMVGYIILGLGAVALLITLWKLVDLRGLAVDEPAPVHAVIAAVRRGAMEEAQALTSKLRRTTQRLLTAGLQQWSHPKTVIEEHLYALILELRLHHERRLPLLGVIVTASPLLGLLGTVTGMVTTFTLITVFGTGDAEKLSSGISEALVTTELGLMVAIPTLIVHGFLGHRVKKRLAMLERYAVEFVTATDTCKAGAPAG